MKFRDLSWHLVLALAGVAFFALAPSVLSAADDDDDTPVETGDTFAYTTYWGAEKMLFNFSLDENKKMRIRWSCDPRSNNPKHASLRVRLYARGDGGRTKIADVVNHRSGEGEGVTAAADLPAGNYQYEVTWHHSSFRITNEYVLGDADDDKGPDQGKSDGEDAGPQDWREVRSVEADVTTFEKKDFDFTLPDNAPVRFNWKVEGKDGAGFQATLLHYSQAKGEYTTYMKLVLARKSDDGEKKLDLRAGEYRVEIKAVKAKYEFKVEQGR